MLVIFDTNFLILPFQFKVDVFSEIRDLLEGKLEFAVLKNSLRELKNLDIGGNVKKLSLASLRDKGFAVIESKIFDTDDAIVDVAVKRAVNEKVIVCTNDLGLRRRLKLVGVKTIGLRGKSKLSLF